MMKKAQLSGQGALITFFFTIMVGVIIVVIAGGFITDQNTKIGVDETNLALTSNASLSFTSLKFADLVSGSEVVIANSTTLTLNTDYVMDYTGGRINVTETVTHLASEGLINITYDRFPPGYTKNNLNRSVLLLLPLLIVVALIVFLAVRISFKE